jgi:hypothetical protein
MILSNSVLCTVRLQLICAQLLSLSLSLSDEYETRFEKLLKRQGMSGTLSTLLCGILHSDVM